MVVAIACLTTDPPRKARVAGEAKSDGRGCKKYHMPMIHPMVSPYD